MIDRVLQVEIYLTKNMILDGILSIISMFKLINFFSFFAVVTSNSTKISAELRQYLQEIADKKE